MWRRKTLFVFGLLIPAAVVAQSLGEVAKKEKKRREENQEKGVHVRVVGEDEVTSGKSDVTTGAEEEPEEDAAPSNRAFDDPVDSGSDRRKEEANWRGRVGEARSRLTAAQEYYDKLASLHLTAGEYYVDENGKPIITSLDQLRRMVAEAEAELDSAKKAVEDLKEEARRAGVPPGWLR